MLDRLPRILRSPQQQRVAPRRRPERQLVQCQALAASLLDPRSRGGGEVERRDRELLGHFEQARVVGDGADDDNGLVGRGHLLAGAARREHAEAGEGERGPVRARHEESAQNDFVEVGVGFACGCGVRWGGRRGLVVRFGGGSDVRARKR